MERKDVRSLLLSLILGDGCLHEIFSSGKLYGGLTIAHANKQKDLLEWKAKLISDLTLRKVKIRKGKDDTQKQLSVCWKRLRAWHKFCYPNRHKSISRILRFIRHPEFALAVWLMDDGYVESSISKLATGEKKNYGARFRIFTCDQSPEEHSQIGKWFEDTFQVQIKVKQAWNSKRGKYYPFIKINQEDSLKLWQKIREFVLQFDSMKYKFRYIEQIFQLRSHSALQD